MASYSRRKLLAALATVAVAGCVSEGEEQPTNNSEEETTDNRDDMTDDTDDTTENQDDDTTDDQQDEDVVAEREAELQRLPERSPLSTTLQNFFAAPDRGAFAENIDGMQYSDGTVRVTIMLEPDGERPEQYLPEETSGYGDTIVADVAADELVDLALEESVRLVSLPAQPQTHD